MNSRRVLKKKVRYKISIDQLLLFFLLVISWILFALNNGNADYTNYSQEYENIKIGQGSDYFEAGFFLLCQIGGFLKLSYPFFLALVATGVMFMMVKSIAKITNRRWIAWMAYMIYPFVFDIVQYRNILAFAIVLCGLAQLHEDINREKIIRFVVCVLISTTIHSSSIVYLVFLLLLMKDTHKLVKWVLIGFVSLMIICIGGSYLSSILTFFHLERFNRYEYSASFSTFAQYAAMYVFLLGAILAKYKGEIGNVRVRVAIISSMLLPFIIVTGSSARFIRSMLIVFYAALSNQLLKEKASKRAMYCFATVGVAMVVFGFQLWDGLYHDIVLQPVLEQNWLWWR